MISWLKKLFGICEHEWIERVYSEGAYDEERWEECIYCLKQRELNVTSR